MGVSSMRPPRLKACEEDRRLFPRTQASRNKAGWSAWFPAATVERQPPALPENATLLFEKAKALSPADLNACGNSSPTTARWLSSHRLRPRSRIPRIFRTQQPRIRPRAYRRSSRRSRLGLIRSHGRRRQEPRLRKEWSRIESSLGRDASVTCLATSAASTPRKQKYILVKEFQEHVTEYKTIDPAMLSTAPCGLCARCRLQLPNTPRRSTNTPSWSTADFKGPAPAPVCFKASGSSPSGLPNFSITERLTYFFAGHRCGYQRAIELIRCAHQGNRAGNLHKSGRASQRSP